jgi:hypothetical protein
MPRVGIDKLKVRKNMNSNKYRHLALAMLGLSLVAQPGLTQAQSDETRTVEDVIEEQTQDKTGTNPVNFMREIRLYNEYSRLNTEGDGSQNLTTMEFRTPFAGGKWQWRFRKMISAENRRLQPT